MVGALLVPPPRTGCDLGVIFFNNVGLLGMCGHGTIGLVASLAHLGRIAPGRVRIDTPVGAVEALLHPDGSVAVDNVASHRAARQITLDVPGHGVVHGDIAWGGNWFLIITEHPFRLATDSLEALTDFSWRARQAANAQGYPNVDHVKLSGPAGRPDHHSRSFVLCPGKAWDRSPCGTGTSAKLACLAADGLLEPGAPWVQESILGTRFVGTYRWCEPRAGRVIAPTITGHAWITARGELILDASDPFRWGRRDGL